MTNLKIATIICHKSCSKFIQRQLQLFMESFKLYRLLNSNRSFWIVDTTAIFKLAKNFTSLENNDCFNKKKKRLPKLKFAVPTNQRESKLFTPLQVILCQINMFCHQLSPKYDNWFFSDFQRFTQIVLKFNFKTCKTCDLNFRIICAKLLNLRSIVVILIFGTKTCLSDKE